MGLGHNTGLWWVRRTTIIQQFRDFPFAPLPFKIDIVRRHMTRVPSITLFSSFLFGYSKLPGSAQNLVKVVERYGSGVAAPQKIKWKETRSI